MTVFALILSPHSRIALHAADGGLKLTIVSPFPVGPPLILGSQTVLRATKFVGAPSAVPTT